jgi:hypothetical protein
MPDGSYNNIDLPDIGKVGCADVVDYIVHGGIRLAPLMPAQFSNPIPFQITNCLILGLSLTRTSSIFLCGGLNLMFIINKSFEAGGCEYTFVYVYVKIYQAYQFVKHPAGLSSLMFAFAALVIHTSVEYFHYYAITHLCRCSVFRTSHTDWNINETSSYVDLSPLYGHNQQAQNRVRVRDGRGLLLPDVFAEERLLFLPPAVCALLVLFSRNHNVRALFCIMYFEYLLSH